MMLQYIMVASWIEKKKKGKEKQEINCKVSWLIVTLSFSVTSIIELQDS